MARKSCLEGLLMILTVGLAVGYGLSGLPMWIALCVLSLFAVPTCLMVLKKLIRGEVG